MDESLLWQLELAKANIHITSVQYNANHKACVICFEFPYHPKPGQVKWFKTAEEFLGFKPNKENFDKIVESGELPIVYLHNLVPSLKNIVLALRKELEG